MTAIKRLNMAVAVMALGSMVGVHAAMAQQATDTPPANAQVTSGILIVPALPPGAAAADANGVYTLSSGGQGGITIDLVSPAILGNPPLIPLPSTLDQAELQNLRRTNQPMPPEFVQWQKDSQAKLAKWRQDNHADLRIQYTAMLGFGGGGSRGGPNGAAGGGAGAVVTSQAMVMGEATPMAFGVRESRIAILPAEMWDQPDLDKVNSIITTASADYDASLHAAAAAANAGSSAPITPIRMQMLQLPKSTPILLGFRTTEGAIGVLKIDELKTGPFHASLEIKELGTVPAATPTADTVGGGAVAAPSAPQ